MQADVMHNLHKCHRAGQGLGQFVTAVRKACCDIFVTFIHTYS